MKHPVTVRKDEKLGRTFIDYYKHKDKENFRFKALEQLLGSKSFFMVINTNFCSAVDNSVPKDNIKVIERYAKDAGYQHTVMPIENTNRKSIFGFISRKNDNNNSSYKIGIFVPEGNFNRDIFDSIFGMYDVEIGIGFEKEQEEIFEDFRKGYFDALFDKGYFTYGLFNAINFNKIVTDLEVDEAYMTSLVNN